MEKLPPGAGVALEAVTQSIPANRQQIEREADLVAIVGW